jgi:hypothetical protein
MLGDSQAYDSIRGPNGELLRAAAGLAGFDSHGFTWRHIAARRGCLIE